MYFSWQSYQPRFHVHYILISITIHAQLQLFSSLLLKFLWVNNAQSMAKCRTLTDNLHLFFLTFYGQLINNCCSFSSYNLPVICLCLSITQIFVIPILNLFSGSSDLGEKPKILQWLTRPFMSLPLLPAASIPPSIPVDSPAQYHPPLLYSCCPVALIFCNSYYTFNYLFDVYFTQSWECLIFIWYFLCARQLDI